MNGKKIVVALLFVLTILIGMAAIYFATTLKPKPTITPTPTPSITITKTPTPTDEDYILTPVITMTSKPTITTEISKLNCGQPCDKGTCMEDLTCTNINGSKKCVSNSCVKLQDGINIPNGICESDLCNIANKITIIKTSTISCISGQNNRKISFAIKITNPVGITIPRLDISVFDILNTNLLDTFIDIKSITNNGKLVNGQIKWENLTLDANGGALELHYDAIVPSTENSKSYSNTVSVLEAGIQKNQYAFEYTVNILPCTALITDEVDRILFGTILLIFGVYIYKMNWHYSMGQYLWMKGIRNIYSATGKTYLNITQKRKKKFERKILEDRKNID
jgi:hypothetical protein